MKRIYNQILKQELEFNSKSCSWNEVYVNQKLLEIEVTVNSTVKIFDDWIKNLGSISIYTKNQLVS